MLKIKNDYVFQDIVIMALRYALPRHTYSVEQVCSFIKEHTEIINERVKEVMLKDIYQTLEDNRTGLYKLHDCDLAEIRTLQIFLENYEVIK